MKLTQSKAAIELQRRDVIAVLDTMVERVITQLPAAAQPDEPDSPESSNQSESGEDSSLATLAGATTSTFSRLGAIGASWFSSSSARAGSSKSSGDTSGDAASQGSSRRASSRLSFTSVGSSGGLFRDRSSSSATSAMLPSGGVGRDSLIGMGSGEGLGGGAGAVAGESEYCLQEAETRMKALDKTELELLYVNNPMEEFAGVVKQVAFNRRLDEW